MIVSVDLTFLVEPSGKVTQIDTSFGVPLPSLPLVGSVHFGSVVHE